MNIVMCCQGPLWKYFMKANHCRVLDTSALSTHGYRFSTPWFVFFPVWMLTFGGAIKHQFATPTFFIARFAIKFSFMAAFTTDESWIRRRFFFYLWSRTRRHSKMLIPRKRMRNCGKKDKEKNDWEGYRIVNKIETNTS